VVGTGVGQGFDNQAEIFNDYENNLAISPYAHAEGKNNIAGCKAFVIDVEATTAEGLTSLTDAELEALHGIYQRNNLDYTYYTSGTYTIALASDLKVSDVYAVGDKLSVKWNSSHID
jgi:hypothetical protein